MMIIKVEGIWPNGILTFIFCWVYYAKVWVKSEYVRKMRDVRDASNVCTYIFGVRHLNFYTIICIICIMSICMIM